MQFDACFVVCQPFITGMVRQKTMLFATFSQFRAKSFLYRRRLWLAEFLRLYRRTRWLAEFLRLYRRRLWLAESLILYRRTHWLARVWLVLTLNPLISIYWLGRCPTPYYDGFEPPFLLLPSPVRLSVRIISRYLCKLWLKLKKEVLFNMMFCVLAEWKGISGVLKLFKSRSYWDEWKVWNYCSDKYC